MNGWLAGMDGWIDGRLDDSLFQWIAWLAVWKEGWMASSLIGWQD
jgi:hypothetical protein